MLKQVLSAIALAFLIIGCSNIETAYIPDVQFDYSGEWTLKWVDSDSRHPVSLAQKGNVLSGIYTNAEDVACSISGKHDRKLNIKIEIDCPRWDISLNGISTQNATAITGNYKGEGGSGKFVMLKNKPAAAIAKKQRG